MGEEPLHTAVRFLTEMFGPSTHSPVYVCSFANQDAVGEPPERHVINRDPDEILRFARKWDRPHRGVYFAVNTIQQGSQKRGKDYVSEINCLHCDIDFDKVVPTEPEILERLRQLRHLPSKVVHSGNGFHLYWLFQESLEGTPENIERTEALLRLLADHLGGDLAACEVSRVLRLPGTHNSKNGEWKEVRIVEDRPIRYQFLDELEEWLETSRPVILRRPKTNGANGHAEHLNPFEAVAELFAGKAPVDVEKTLNEMALGNIHQSQLSVTAALLNRGHELEEVVKIVLDATKAASGEFGQRWNWRREERGVREMCASWKKKHPEIGHAVEAKQEEAVKVKKIKWVDYDDKKKPAKTCANAHLAIQALGITCRKDAFHEKYLVGGHPIAQWSGELSDDAILMLRRIIKEEFGFDPGTNNTYDAAIQLCLENQFNPVTEYLDALKWDGIPRIDRWMIDYLGAEDTELNREVGRLFLIATVRRARSPGCKFDQILVLEGIQGAGKSTAFKILAGEENFSDQHILSVSDREQQEAFRGVWIHEIAELSGMSKTEVERIKQFASRTDDRARPAYGRSRVDMKRRGIFVASTNKETYLKDDTGNRRFWPVKVGEINLTGISRERDQLWAEAAQLEFSGASIELDKKYWEKATKEQEARTEEEVWEEAIALFLVSREETSIAAVLTDCLEIKKGDFKRSDEMRVAKILKNSGFARVQKSVGGKLVWYYRKTPPAPRHEPTEVGEGKNEVGESEASHSGGANGRDIKF